MTLLRTLYAILSGTYRARPKATSEDSFTRLKAVAASGQSGCRAAQQRLREATHAGLRQAVGR